MEVRNIRVSIGHVQKRTSNFPVGDTFICDVIWENPANLRSKHCPFFTIMIIDFFFNWAKIKENVFCRWSYVTKTQALIRRRAESAVSDQSLSFVSLYKPGFPRWRHISSLRHVN